MDALESDLESLRAAKPQLCVEIGSGSGCVITFLAKILQSDAPILCLAVDINPAANTATRETGLSNGIPIDPIRGCLTDGLRLDGLVDVLLFNPPYVPTETQPLMSQERIMKASEDELLECSWAGGQDGRYWIDLLMPRISVNRKAFLRYA